MNTFEREFRVALLADGETVELVMYDFIGADFFGEGITDKMVERALAQAPAAKTIRIRMNSPGGDAFMGFTIANLLRAHPARKEMDVEGACASVATAVAMICAEVRMWPGSQMMIHEARGAIFRASATDMRSRADMLEGMNADIAKMYAAKTGKTEADVRALMSAETWLTAQKAVDERFADKLVEGQPKAQALAMMRAGIERCGYRNVPAELATQIARAPSSNGEDTIMNKKLLAKLLGIADSAPDDSFDEAVTTVNAELRDLRACKTVLARLEQVTGKTGDEAVGVVLAWKGSHEELPKTSAKLAELNAKVEDGELDAAIVKAKAESRHTPARETEVRALLTSKDLTAAGAKAMVGAWGKVAALAAAKDGANPAGAGTGEQLKHNGKTYAEMNSKERTALLRENEELFNAMRKQAVDAGLV